MNPFSCSVLTDISLQLGIWGLHHSIRLSSVPLGNVVPHVCVCANLVFKCCAVSWDSGIKGLSKLRSTVYPGLEKPKTLYETQLMFSCPLLLQPRVSELCWSQPAFRRGISTSSPNAWAHQPHSYVSVLAGMQPKAEVHFHTKKPLELTPAPSLLPACLANLPFQKNWSPSASHLGAWLSAASPSRLYWTCWWCRAQAHLCVTVRREREREKALARRKGLSQLWKGSR